MLVAIASTHGCVETELMVVIVGEIYFRIITELNGTYIALVGKVNRRCAIVGKILVSALARGKSYCGSQWE